VLNVDYDVTADVPPSPPVVFAESEIQSTTGAGVRPCAIDHRSGGWGGGRRGGTRMTTKSRGGCDDDVVKSRGGPSRFVVAVARDNPVRY
jgi:hypothetical protein